MPTPVGPAPRDPDDPDLWDEWYDGDEEGGAIPSHGLALRVVALVVAVAVVVLLVLSV